MVGRGGRSSGGGAVVGGQWWEGHGTHESGLRALVHHGSHNGLEPHGPGEGVEDSSSPPSWETSKHTDN